jgi:uncharacterized protein
LEILGYISAVLIGLSLGLIGSGGSILTVPILVYLFSVSPVTATSYSLFVVGLTALIGAAAYMRKDLVSYKTALVFAIPSFTAVFLTRKYLLPAIPEEIFSIGEFVYSKDLLIMLLFAVLMVLASVSMIKKNKKFEEAQAQKFNYPMIMIEGFVVGILTGLVGAGGGFLIIPALVVLAKLPMKLAVGTSLLIIAAKSLIGFTGDLGEIDIEWLFLFKFSLFAVAGIFLGSYLSQFISGAKLKPAFGWFVLVMGIYIIGREISTSL